jgi:hypothetical protein
MLPFIKKESPPTIRFSSTPERRESTRRTRAANRSSYPMALKLGAVHSLRYPQEFVPTPHSDARPCNGRANPHLQAALGTFPDA